MDGRKSELISANDYYQNIEPVDADEITAEETLSYSFGPFGAPAKARMTLARSKTSSFAFNSSPMERCPGSPRKLRLRWSWRRSPVSSKAAA